MAAELDVKAMVRTSKSEVHWTEVVGPFIKGRGSSLR